MNSKPSVKHVYYKCYPEKTPAPIIYFRSKLQRCFRSFILGNIPFYIFFYPLLVNCKSLHGQDPGGCTPPSATIEASSCEGAVVGLKLKDATGHAPFNLKVNGVTFDSVEVGQTFALIAEEQSVWASTGKPDNANANDGESIEVGVKIRSDLDGYITGIRFYKGAQNTGTHTGSLWTSAGIRLASATFQNETASGWQEVRFSTPVAIKANTTYIASYLSPQGFYAFTGNYFAYGDITNKQLTAPQSTSGEANGVYKYGGGFPDNSYSNSNYWVDVLFSSSPFSGRTTKFTLTSITDSQNCNATGEALSQASVTINPLPSGTIKVSDQSCESNQINLVFDPKTGTGPFDLVINGTSYTNIPRDSAFGVASETTSAVSIWGNNTLPASAAVSSDTSGVELGVKFKSNVSGAVMGIRFYKNPANSASHSGSLWAPDGTLLATGIFNNETSTGWQQLIFPTPVVIQADTVYIASYYTPVGRYMFQKDFFTNNAASNSFLTAPATSVDESNGVYKYSENTAFPTESFNGTNYWVDVVFKPDTVFTPENKIFHLTNITDANNCTLAADSIYDLAVAPLSCPPSFMDSLAPLTCSPQSLKITLSKPVSCASIASDGSDFTVEGPYAVAVRAAHSDCSSNNYTSEVIIELDQPLQKAGKFYVHIKNGSDGNTLLDQREQQTPKDSTLAFAVKDTVHALFTYAVRYGCTTDTVFFKPKVQNGVDTWLWKLDDNLQSTDQNPIATYSAFNTKKIFLVASNGVCSDTTNADVELNNTLTVDFDLKATKCSPEPVEFLSTATGQIVKHEWTFGDGTFSNQPSPLHSYQQAPQNSNVYQVNYSITDQYGCTKSITKPVDIFSNCTIYVPNAFTPNGDGKNDVFKPLNVNAVEQFEFRVLNRWGQEIFMTKNSGSGWNGSYNDRPQSSGTYIWTMRYADKNSGKIVEQKGTFILIR